jgi:hypothetical protein
MQTRFWKLSHGSKEFTAQELLQSIEQRLAYIHGNTRRKWASISQAEDFINNALIGDYFYLTYGNRGIYIIRAVSWPPNWLSVFGDGWVDRPFRLIREATEVKPYSGPHKRWAPNDRSTFIPVPETSCSYLRTASCGRTLASGSRNSASRLAALKTVPIPRPEGDCQAF